ncbi:hypothetical protein EMGBS15_11960 [Filimonas sp.]|nr:hypothetical protein EMGBS15_11960 [Filimonas sp.]
MKDVNVLKNVRFSKLIFLMFCLFPFQRVKIGYDLSNLTQPSDQTLDFETIDLEMPLDTQIF